jgi:hypothetical protein
MRTLPEWNLGHLGRLYDVVCITCMFWSPYSQRILWIRLLKKKALVGLDVLLPQKNHSCAKEARGWRAYAAYSASPYRREQTWRESLQLWRNEEQLSTEAVQLRSKPGELQESAEARVRRFIWSKEDPGAEPSRKGKDHSKP